MKTITITPRGASQPCLPEAAPAGEAATALNVRECGPALRVTGNPIAAGSIPTGRQLLLVDGDRLITHDGTCVYHGDTVLATVEGTLVGAHRVGDVIIIATTAGMHWLRRGDDSYTPISLADACPDIALNALEWDTAQAGLGAVTFATAYAQWPTTLATTDVNRLTAMLRQAWNATQQTIDNAGAYAGMMQVRCGVRLHDDSYLWLSDPVTLGDETLADAEPIDVETTLDGTQVTGIPASTLTRHRYRLGITVKRGVAADWHTLVKAVDILATTCVVPVLAGGTAQYRCIGIGGSVRRPRLEMGLPAVSQGAVTGSLAVSGWHVVATTDDLSALDSHRWVSEAVSATTEVVVPGITGYVVTRAVEHSDRLTAGQAREIERQSEPLTPVASMTANGRLYCIDAQGVLAVSAVGNPLVTARQQAITGVEVRAIVPLARAIYSNGFGRYPIALFTDEGIYALPQTTSGATFGEPRLLDRTVMAQDCRPIEADRDVYFVDRDGHLCRLRASAVDVVWRDMGMCRLAWNRAHRELWCLTTSGAVFALMSGGRCSARSIEAEQFYYDNNAGLAVTAEGTLLDLTREQTIENQPFEWQSHPIAAGTSRQVVWMLSGQGTMTLEVTGERGFSCHGFDIGRLRVSGSVNAPLRQHLLAPPSRTVRLRVAGQAGSGALLSAVRLSVPSAAR